MNLYPNELPLFSPTAFGCKPLAATEKDKMTTAEIYNMKRENFKKNSLVNFEYLTKDFGYELQEHKEGKQDNGTVISDEIIYLNVKLDRQISLYNAYHPVDYGFELNIYKPTISSNHGSRQILHYVLKENQDIEQTYLISASQLLKTKYLHYIDGTVWFSSKDHRNKLNSQIKIETQIETFKTPILDKFEVFLQRIFGI